MSLVYTLQLISPNCLRTTGRKDFFRLRNRLIVLCKIGERRKSRCLRQYSIPKVHTLVHTTNRSKDRAFIFQENGTTCHTGCYAAWWKSSDSIKCFNYWSAQGQDLNLIELLWSYIESTIHKKRTAIKDSDDFKAALETA